MYILPRWEKIYYWPATMLFGLIRLIGSTRPTCKSDV